MIRSLQLRLFAKQVGYASQCDYRKSMKQFVTPVLVVFFFLSVLVSGGLYGQQQMIHARNGMNATPRNYTSFVIPAQHITAEAKQNNPGYEQYAELGMLFAETPCDNCYELIGKRTEISKTFVKEGTNGRDIMQQTGSKAIHYKDADGNWKTIKTRLEPGNKTGTFTAGEQETPVLISPQEKMASLGNGDLLLQFNNNLELVYEKPDGTQKLVGAADYSHYTAGDDGVYITNAWPGIDIEMYVARGAVKTNYIINNALPAYADGKLLVRDHFNWNKGWSVYVPGDNGHKYTGKLEIRNDKGKSEYNISAATAYEQKESRSTLQYLEYAINGNVLDIELPGDFLNRPAAAYPVIIDPLMSFATSSTVAGGSAYSPAWTAACPYFNSAIVPAGVTVTDVQFTFSYTTGGGAHINNGAFDFVLGACRSPTPTAQFWTCTDTSTGTCNLINTTIFPEIHTCIPAPTCASYPLNLTMYFSQNYGPTSPSCSNAYISALGNLTITVYGHTAEAGTIATSPSSICPGQTATMTATSLYGVGPFSYSWLPGGGSGATVSVNPTSSTTYTLSATDACGNAYTTTNTVIVNSAGSVSGLSVYCIGGSSTLTDPVGPGTWSSSAVTKATVGSSTGLVTGIASGTSTITYTSPAGCSATYPILVKPDVAPIGGAVSMCQGSTTTLDDTTAGGTWSSSNPGVAGISGSGSLGVATGVSTGTAFITYTVNGAGCYSVKNLTVNALAPVLGISSICVGGSTTFTDAAPGGTWTVTNPSIASIGSSSGIVNGFAAGTDTINYTLPSGCTTSRSLSVYTLAAITGTAVICQGATSLLSHPVSGGTWTSSNIAIATINATSGLLSGVAGGTSLISYALPGGCYATVVVTINANPSISGSSSLCVGGTTTYTGSPLAGTWASSNTVIATAGTYTGIITGAAIGVCNISYTSSAGCTSTTPVTVSLASPVTGVTSLCPGGSVSLSDVTPGGSWSSSNLLIATVGTSTGIVSGLTGGVVNISYTNPSGCTVFIPVSVNPISPIIGATELCAGNTVSLSNSIPFGTWSSGSPTVATIDPGLGTVTGVSSGTAAITYATPSGCIATITVTVDNPAPISGTTSVCLGNTSVLSDPVTGGSWTSSDPTVALIGGTSGLVNSIGPGVTTINYTTSAGCVSTVNVTINPVAPISGTPSVCVGNSVTLGNTIGGGSWSSANPAVAAIGLTSGNMTGMASGITAINYTTPAGCTSTVTATVRVTPSAITGSALICNSSIFTDAITGGNWISSDATVATVGSLTGVVTGVGAGTITITYTLPDGCFATIPVTVDPVVSITGTTTVCQGSTTLLSYPSTGGTWSSLSPAVASAGAATGVVTGVSGGVTMISYTKPSGCVATIIVTVNPDQPITGLTSVCQGSSIILSDATPGGTWSSADVTIALAGTLTGVVSGIAAGPVNISYTTAAGCNTVTTITVNPLEATTGNHTVCVGSSITLSNTTTGGGSWNSLLPSVASVLPLTGTVTGALAGTTTIQFISSLGCIANFSVTVNPLPSAIIGALGVCLGSTTSLSNSFPGGTWSSGNTAVATIGSATGVLTGVTLGTASVSYTTTAGCLVSAVTTINPLPLSITGLAIFCQGSTSNLYDATPGGSWSSVSPAIATVGSTGVVSGVLPGTSYIKYTTPAGCFVARQVTINALPSPIAGTTVLCVGASSPLTDTLPGGTWNSTYPVSATVGMTSGLLSGVAAGNAVITYITSAGCYVTASVTINPTPVISDYSFTNPTTCINNDGSVTLNGLTPGETFTVHYTLGSLPVTVSLTANGSGNINITSLAAGTYSNFSVTTSLGCTSNLIAGPIVLSMPPTPATPVVMNNTPICAGSTIKFTANDATGGVTYLWAGPGGYSSTLQNPQIISSTVTESGTYTVTVSKLSCVSAPATTVVVVHPIPDILKVISSNPSTCAGSDGSITLEGLAPGVSYSISYLLNGTGASLTKVADAAGDITITGLREGYYSSIYVSSFTCLSNIAGPVTLNDPQPPPAPVVWSNSPVCAGKTLSIHATDSATNLTWDWQGPNGYSSLEQDPVIPDVSAADSGLFTLTIKRLNCATTVAEIISVHPSVVLTNVTQSQVMPLGGSIKLSADGAEFYLWLPDDGTISNPQIDSPIANPEVSTVYSIIGMNTWGCPDTAYVSLTIDDNIDEYIPNTFTANGDGKNDIFRLVNVKYDKLVDFTVYNRWGQLVYHNSLDVEAGWDGKYHGVNQDIGTYFYNITVTRPDGKPKTFKGEVLLIR